MITLTNQDYRDFTYRLLKAPIETGRVSFMGIASRMLDSSFKLTTTVEIEICQLICRWADACDLRFYGGMYYAYDGKVYSELDNDMLYWAFKTVIRDCGININLYKLNYWYRFEFQIQIRTLHRLELRNNLVAFQNGVVDLTNFTLHPFSPEFHVTDIRPFKFDPRATCPKWLEFLKEVLPDRGKREVLQMFMGLGVLDRKHVYGRSSLNKVNLSLLLVGSGANGKSVILDTAKGIFGSRKISGLDYDTITADGDEGMRNRGSLIDVIFNWCDDESSSRFGNKRTAGIFKRMVSGEPVPMRRLKHDPQMVLHVPYLVFNLNDLPYPDDSSLGFLRRLQIIYFSKSIPESKQNKHLAEELISEYPGIFNWLVRGARELQRRDFTFPYTEANKKERMLVSLTKSPVKTWAECYGIRNYPSVEAEAPIWIPAEDMHKYIGKFCEDNDVEQMTPNMIGRQLKEARFAKKRTVEGYYYKTFGVHPNALARPFIINNMDSDGHIKGNNDANSFLLLTD